jgi:hypothetical protein
LATTREDEAIDGLESSLQMGGGEVVEDGNRPGASHFDIFDVTGSYVGFFMFCWFSALGKDAYDGSEVEVKGRLGVVLVLFGSKPRGE